MKTFALMLIVLGVGVGVASAADPKVAPVRVFITSPAAASGFTDPSKDRADSMKDLRKKVAASKVLLLAESTDDATIVLEVLDRNEDFKRTTMTTLLGGPFARERKRSVVVRLNVREFTSEFSAEKNSYGAAAGEVVKQIEAWVKANRHKLP